jgi:type VI secretion system secreted protein VgrG
MRLIQPHAGAGKGFYFIPEIDEEVLVGFEGGSAERPYIMGTNYNGSESSGYNTSGNDQKVIHTRSGTKMIFNDAEGSVFIEDPSGNTWKMDGQGNIDVTAPKNFTVNAGENVSITAGKNVTVSAGENISSSAGNDIIDTSGANINQIATADYMLMAKNITKIASDNYSADAKDITRNASGKIEAISVKEHIQNSKGKIQNLSGEKSLNA